jgi:hypothetical protein
MLTLRQLHVLLAVTFVAWLGPWAIDLLWPGSPFAGPLSLLSLVLSVLGVSAGLFFGVQAWHLRPAERRGTAGTVAGFLLMAVCTMALGVMTLLALGLEEKSAPPPSASLVAHLEKSLGTEKDAARRRDIAQGIYSFTGSAVSFEGADGRVVIYEPTKGDRDRAALRQQNSTATEGERALAAGARGSAVFLISVYGVVVVLSTAAGFVVARGRKRAMV